MSTWHQRVNMPVLWHPTKWTVISDPPDQALCICGRHDSAQQANEMMARLGKHCYVLPPASVTQPQKRTT